ncbi:MAG: hypothetical protein LBQ21_06380 [Clostridiales Family XIII bacterium]|jgi:hypothetical protein|nr:hypothetical protein [Clostridiales Family XIII bacterium]
MDSRKYSVSANIIIIATIVGLLFFGDIILFALAYGALFIFMTARMLATPAKKSIKTYLFITLLMIMLVQIAADILVVCPANASMGFSVYGRRGIGVILLLLPFVMNRYISIGQYSSFYLPSMQEAATISFTELKTYRDDIRLAIAKVDHARKSLSPENMKYLISELPRHDFFRYINNGSLTPEYFTKAYASLSDPYIYIVISNTGSVANEMVSVVTQKQFNHASLAFDSELDTIISYNGGERVYPPGLNREMIDSLNKKQDSSILVYRLSCTEGQKRLIIKKVEEINREGNAYNMLGLVLKYSHKPNIMFCSQFVYRMLRISGLAYFNKDNGKVRPTDLIELDYYKKLQFVYELRLSNGVGNSAKFPINPKVSRPLP